MRQPNYPRTVLINIGITQRVEVVESYQETRDCLDQKWSLFAQEAGFNLLPLATLAPQQVEEYVKDLHLSGLILSGGNSIASLNPEAKDSSPKRDAFEKELIRVAISHKLPLLGVCRGMQYLNVYFAGHLSAIKQHVAVRHALLNTNNNYSLPAEINSFHNWSIHPSDLAQELRVLATDKQGNIEAFEHVNTAILGIMWHPERETPFNQLDIQLFRKHLL